jgi:hypothetical protein
MNTSLWASLTWVVDPVSLSGEIRTRNGMERVSDGRFRVGAMEVNRKSVTDCEL